MLDSTSSCDPSGCLTSLPSTASSIFVASASVSASISSSPSGYSTGEVWTLSSSSSPTISRTFGSSVYMLRSFSTSEVAKALVVASSATASRILGTLLTTGSSVKTLRSFSASDVATAPVVPSSITASFVSGISLTILCSPLSTLSSTSEEARAPDAAPSSTATLASTTLSTPCSSSTASLEWEYWFTSIVSPL